VGYFVGAIATDLPKDNALGFDWRKAFAVQGFVLILIAIGFMCFDNDRIDIFGDRVEEVPHNTDLKSLDGVSQFTRKEVAHTKLGTGLPLREFRDLLCNKVYLFTMMSVCAIFFSSSGL